MSRRAASPSPSAPPPLSPGRARLRFDAAQFSFGDTSRLPDPDRIVGQELAVEAIDFALSVDSADFHVFAAGPTGTGRATLVKAMAHRAARRRPVPPDVCCLHSFGDPERPLTVSLPAGSARVFAAEMSRLADFLRRAVPAALSSKEYRARHQAILEEVVDARREHFTRLEQRATSVGLAVEDASGNLQLMPLLPDGTEMSEEQYEALSEDERRALDERERSIRDDILEYLDHAKRIQDTAEESLNELDHVTITRIVEPKIQVIRESLPFPEVQAWLDDVLQDVIDTAETLLPPDETEPGPALADALRGPRAPAERYEVNVLVDNTNATGAPVQLELNPTYANLFGKVERRMSFGALETNHTLVRGGSILKANGGILIIDAGELLSHPFGYPALKRTLREGATSIEDPDDPSAGLAVVTLRPAPIPVRVQLVLLGTLEDYVVLRDLDPEFAKLFKVRADFEESVELTPQSAQGFACFVASVCRERQLRHFSQDAVAALLELGSRMAGRQDEISLQLDALNAVIVEADHWARRDNGTRVVQRRHVEQASSEARRRSSLFQRRTLREFARKTLLISIDGALVGQVNGLAVLGVGDILFGMPSRITAKTFVGESGVVNIERETELSGQIHSKATLILNGYLGAMYAQRSALALCASLTFEQNYTPVEGDSASIAELVALLSSLADLPVRQDLAVTGSMSQHGEVQPIGGVNEKIEGFFHVCSSSGLTGTQGVIIPSQNAIDLNLQREVVDAMTSARFHVYPVDHVDDAIHLLLGVAPGHRRPDGTFTSGGVHHRVAKRLAAMAAAIRDAGAPTPRAGRTPRTDPSPRRPKGGETDA